MHALDQHIRRGKQKRGRRQFHNRSIVSNADLHGRRRSTNGPPYILDQTEFTEV
jgi:ribosomal protein L35